MFFFNDTATTEIYTSGHTLSLHDALPICQPHHGKRVVADLDDLPPDEPRIEGRPYAVREREAHEGGKAADDRSEEHTSELQSLMRTSYAVFCLKKKTRSKQH